MNAPIGTSITLVLEPKTLDYIATVLAARPYSEVAAVLAELQQQVRQQQQLPLTGPQMPNGADAPQPVQ